MSTNGNYTPPTGDFWRQSVTDALPNGVSDITKPIYKIGPVGIGFVSANPQSALDMAGAITNRVVLAPNVTANGPIGSAGATTNVAGFIRLNQSTAGISLTLPSPSPSVAGHWLTVMNGGSVAVTVAGIFLPTNTMASWIWSGTAWIPVAGSTRKTFAATGTTDASGNVVFALPVGMFLVAPVVSTAVQIASASVLEGRITALSATSCTINVQGAAAVTILAISVLAAAVPVSGAIVHATFTTAG